jgi:anti-sigma factor RsiW
MSSNNHITLSNYEEYFILYIDDELSVSEREQVESFVVLHPHLREELDALLSTKMPADNILFHAKEQLLSSSMKLNVVDEDLLLYVDNELSASKKAVVAQKIETEEDYALQHSLLMQTKVDKEEVIPYPNKKELYRHTERVVYFPVWMRVAVAVVILLLGTLFFLSGITSNVKVDTSVAKKTEPVKQATNTVVPEQKIFPANEKEAPVVVKTQPAKKKVAAPVTFPSQKNDKQQAVNNDVAVIEDEDLAPQKRQVITFDVSRFTEPSISEDRLNKNIAYTPVTSRNLTPYNVQNDPTDGPESEGDFETTKKTKGKGFFRKVSRFIERRTGIGTVNADNELLIGAMALKLK